MRCPLGDQLADHRSVSFPERPSLRSTRRCALRPSASASQSSGSYSEEPKCRNAICDPSGDTTPSCASSSSICGPPPRIDTLQIFAFFCGLQALVSSRCVLSGYQLVGTPSKPIDSTNGLVSPPSMSRIYTPVSSEYATYLPSGGITAPVTGTSGGLAVMRCATGCRPAAGRSHQASPTPSASRARPATARCQSRILFRQNGGSLSRGSAVVSSSTTE